MKKLYLILIIALFGNLNAQTEFGVKAGYNLSNMNWSVSGFDDFNFGSYSYFFIGGLAEYRLSDQFSLQGELLYTELGGKDSQDLTALVGNEIVEMGTANYKIVTSQIQIPISAKYYFVPNFSLSAGVNFGININSRVKTDFNFDEFHSGKTDLFQTLNIFPFLGTEYKFNSHLFADARYHFGFFNTAIKNATTTKIGFMQIGLGYRFK